MWIASFCQSWLSSLAMVAMDGNGWRRLDHSTVRAFGAALSRDSGFDLQSFDEQNRN
jgi:hypothetical protein